MYDYKYILFKNYLYKRNTDILLHAKQNEEQFRKKSAKYF